MSRQRINCLFGRHDFGPWTDVDESGFIQRRECRACGRAWRYYPEPTGVALRALVKALRKSSS